MVLGTWLDIYNYKHHYCAIGEFYANSCSLVEQQGLFAFNYNGYTIPCCSACQAIASSPGHTPLLKE